jgi:hypothetical protein
MERLEMAVTAASYRTSSRFQDMCAASDLACAQTR